jgi:hypothetical protein
MLSQKGNPRLAFLQHTLIYRRFMLAKKTSSTDCPPTKHPKSKTATQETQKKEAMLKQQEFADQTRQQTTPRAPGYRRHQIQEGMIYSSFSRQAVALASSRTALGSTARLAHVMVRMMVCSPDYTSLGGEGMAVAATSVGASEVSRFTSATSSTFVDLSSAGSFRLAFSSASARQSSRIDVRTFGASSFLLLPRGAGSSGVRQ